MSLLKQRKPSDKSYKPKLLRRIVHGINRHPWKFLGGWFLGYTAIWAIVEPINAFFPDYFVHNNSIKYAAMVLIGLIISVFYRIPPIEMSFEIKGSNTKVEIIFGDLFSQNGDIAFAVNDFFDYDIQIIKSFTLHGKFVSEFYPKPYQFAADIDNSLSKYQSNGDRVLRRDVNGDILERNLRYPIGTTGFVDKENRRYFLCALTQDAENQGTEATVLDLWKSLNGLWNEVRSSRKSDTVNIPLIGSGYADIGLPDQLLVQIVLSSILASTKERRFAEIVRIILLPDKLDSIDLNRIRDAWSL